mgnify:CR=1 FL=1
MKPLGVYMYDMSNLVWLITFGLAPYDMKLLVGLFWLISMGALNASKAWAGPSKAKRPPRHRKT